MSFFEPKTAKNQGITTNSQYPSSEEEKKPKDLCNQGRFFFLPQNVSVKESGNVMVWIFVMIALFAALSFAVSKGTRSGMGGISDQQTSLAATEILDYANAIKRAVQELQINGCSDTQISFENAFLSAFSNPNSPSDNSCHVFHPNGAGLSGKFGTSSFSFGSLPSNYISDNLDGYIMFTGSNKVNGLGTTSHELILGLRAVNANASANNDKTKICEEINKKLGITSTPTGTGLDLQIPFNGTYGVNNSTLGIVSYVPEFDRTSEGCYFYDNGWIYYKVLIVR